MGCLAPRYPQCAFTIWRMLAANCYFVFATMNIVDAI